MLFAAHGARRKAPAHSGCRCGVYEALVFLDTDLGSFIHRTDARAEANGHSAPSPWVEGSMEIVVGVCDDAMGHVMAPQLPAVGHFYDVAGGNDRYDTCAHSRDFSDTTWASGLLGRGPSLSWG